VFNSASPSLLREEDENIKTLCLCGEMPDLRIKTGNGLFICVAPSGMTAAAGVGP